MYFYWCYTIKFDKMIQILKISFSEKVCVVFILFILFLSKCYQKIWMVNKECINIFYGRFLSFFYVFP